jgi:hypothetical protein
MTVPSWMLPIRGLPFWRGALRSIVWGGGAVLLVSEFGAVGLLVSPLLIPAVWLVEGIIMGALAVLRYWRRGRARTKGPHLLSDTTPCQYPQPADGPAKGDHPPVFHILERTVLRR